jgi:hypothetical protein
MTFQIWTSSVSSRSAPLSACHGTRHLAQWTRTEMSGGRERGRRPSRGGAYLNMMMPPMKVAQRAAPDPAHRWSLLGGGAGSRAPLAVVVEEGPPCTRQRPIPPRRRRGPRRPRAPRWPPGGPARERQREIERERERIRTGRVRVWG